MRKSMEEKDEGFTLIELLVVIIIIGILAAIAIPVFLSQRQKGYDAQTKSDLRNAALAEETYATDNSTYLGCTGAAACKTALPGYNYSAGDLLWIGTATAGATTGYCIVGKSKSNNYFYYDSGLGGLQTGVPSTTLAVPSGGACVGLTAVPAA